MGKPPAEPEAPAEIEANPVRRARAMVEAQVPLSRRGPGWSRHWDELEAYVEKDCGWTGAVEPD